MSRVFLSYKAKRLASVLSCSLLFTFFLLDLSSYAQTSPGSAVNRAAEAYQRGMAAAQSGDLTAARMEFEGASSSAQATQSTRMH